MNQTGCKRYTHNYKCEDYIKDSNNCRKCEFAIHEETVKGQKAIEALEEIKEIVKHWATGGDSDESMVSISEMLIDKGVETVFERVKALEDEEGAESEGEE